MPPVCSICQRGDVAAINGLLLERRSALSVAKELGLSEDAVQRHKQRGHAKIVTIPRQVPAISEASPIDELVHALRERALAGNDPQMAHQYRLALQAQKEANSTPVSRDLASEPEWVTLRSKMLTALEPYPEARIAVADALA